METVLHQDTKITLETIETPGKSPTFLLKDGRSQMYVLPQTGRYDRFRAGYEGSTNVEAFLKAFFHEEISDVFEALADRYPRR